MKNNDEMKSKDELNKNAQEYSKRFINSINEAVTPYHAIEHFSKELESKGFTELREKESWKLKKEGKYYITRNNSTIVAFTIGGKINNSNSCFKIVGTHSDSPNLRLAPQSYALSNGFEKATFFFNLLSIVSILMVEEFGLLGLIEILV
jgi:aspartyl aminopeptidase